MPHEISTAMQIVAGVIVALASYMFGNINNAIFISKLKGKDIRTCGSGNPGTMNMIRTFGKGIGVITLLLDVLKGVVPCILGWFFMGQGEFMMFGADRIGMYIGGLAVTLGHIYPVTMKFKGGKGVATILGVCATIHPFYTLIFFVLGVLFLLVTKIGSLTSFLMMCAPLTVEAHAVAQTPLGWLKVLIIFAMFALTMFAHRKNLVKLFSGTEGRVVLFKSKKKKPEKDMSQVFDVYIIAE